MAATYRWDDFVLDLDAYRLERSGVPLSLEPKALNLLALMVERPGHLFTKQEIFDAIWPHTAVTDHALTRVVAQLRRVLGDEAREARYIETVPTRGYRWIRPLHHETRQPPAGHPPATRDTDPAAAPAVPDSIVPAPRPARSIVARSAAVLVLTTGVVALLASMPRDGSTSATDHPAGVGGSRTRTEVRWPIQATTHDGLDLQPSWSPRGDAMAFVSDRTGSFEIYVRGLGGSAADTPLTSDRAQNVQPAWSPDGAAIAYHSARRGGIWVIPSRGGTPRQIVAVGSNPSWAPDGARIAFQSDEHADVNPTASGAQSGSTIWSVRPDGSDLREMTRGGSPVGGHASPSWSADGRYLVFTVFEAGPGNGVYLLDVATGATREVRTGSDLYEAVFAPDVGAVYVSGGEAVIIRLGFDKVRGVATGERELIPVPGVPGVRGLSIAGTRIAFGGLGVSSQIWAQRLDRDGGGVGPARPLTRDTSRRNSLPAIAPDGSHVAYMSIRSGELPNVWLMGIDGSRAAQLTSDEAADTKPAWFRDGQRIAYVSKRGPQTALWAVDVTTRREELLFDIGRAGRSPGARSLAGRLAEIDLAPSMQRAAFSVIPSPGRRVMYVTAVDAFTPRALSDGSSSVGYPAWSPDERSLAVEVKDGSSTHAAVIDVESGTLRQVTRERGQTWVSSWSPDGRRIAFAALRAGVWNLQWVDVTSGRIHHVSPPEPPHVYVRYPEWSPRGDVIVFERGELRGNIWTLTLE